MYTVRQAGQYMLMGCSGVAGGGGAGKRLQGFGLSTCKSEVEEGKTAGVDPDGRLGAQFLTS